MAEQAVQKLVGPGKFDLLAEHVAASFKLYQAKRAQFRRLTERHEKKVREAIEAYNQARVDAFKKLLEEEKLVWCPRNHHLIPQQKLWQFQVSGERDRGSCESAYTEDFTEVWTMCQECAERFLENHGSLSIRKLPTFATECEVDAYQLSKLMHERGFPARIDPEYESSGDGIRRLRHGAQEIPF